ncbi:hypothetical protein [Methylotenera sp. 1P/1]|uniref:hypothetical protein n=1 Tax=Methylotenera sp. 1P/1 TaxID=1131551 RepID=UPI000362705E|nr:hypothetical protein [Methylotenera sp. 1P/1]
MKTRARKQTKNNRLKYALFAMLGLISLLAYAMQSKPNQAMENESTVKSGHGIGIPSIQAAEAHTPFIQRWEKAFSQIDPVLRESPFKHANFFQEGEIVASNDVFDLPTEETGAGVAKGLEQYVMDLEDAIAAGFMPYQDSGNFSGGGVGGAGGGGSGGKNKQPIYLVKKEDIDPNNTHQEGGQDNVSAVPVPPAIWLLSSALLALMGLRRKHAVL